MQQIDLSQFDFYRRPLRALRGAQPAEIAAASVCGR